VVGSVMTNVGEMQDISIANEVIGLLQWWPVLKLCHHFLIWK
jgi:hypothetical protein